jgi:hypothetical protein
MRPTEWALEEKIDPCLFMYWKNKLVTIKEFNELKLRVGIKTIGGTKC